MAKICCANERMLRACINNTSPHKMKKSRHLFVIVKVIIAKQIEANLKAGGHYGKNQSS